MSTASPSSIAVCRRLTEAISGTQTVDEIYTIALDALEEGLGVSRSSVLLFDRDGVMRFKAFRGLSEPYRRAVEGHTPWRPDSPNPHPLVVGDVRADPSLQAFVPIIEAEGIAAMTFVPLVSLGRVIGKFMLYYEQPQLPTTDELQLAELIASQVAFAVARTHAEEQARRSEARLRFALDAASMGTWDWNVGTRTLLWSDNLEKLHGLGPGTFDGTFASYEREIHPEDRERVLGAIQQTMNQGTPLDVEYRIVAPDGSVRWVEGKGVVEYEDGLPVRMTGVCMTVTRRKEAELARLTAAEESGRLKDEFLATLSHELRTPLNAILGWVQLLRASGLSSDRVHEAVEVIGRNAKLQAQLIEDILDISRIITGKLEIDRSPLYLPQLLDLVASGARPAAEAKGIELVSAVPPDLPPIEGDVKRLHQIFGNVLSNAVKFTPAGGRIEIRASADDETIRIEVQDTGVGIDPEFQPYVFDRFRQADSRSTRRHGGLGLGLAIARHLVEQHDGRIETRSAGQGCGTTVIVTLPARGDDQQDVDPAFERVTLPELRDLALCLEGSTVVVVDDQRDSRELLGALFERCGATVVQCDSAESAVGRLTTPGVQLLVADIAMPDVDGYELIRRVRRTCGPLPAVAVSAYARPQDRARAFTAGFNGYCAKPIEAAQFLRTVREVMRA